MFYGTWNQGAVNARKLWEEDKKKRVAIAQNPELGRSDFKSASKALNNQVVKTGFVKKSDKKGSKSFKWETENLHDMPKSMGKSYDEKFKNFAKAIGISDVEANQFRTYLDAKEKKMLTSDEMDNIFSHVKPASLSKAKEDSTIVPNKRSGLDRTFDALLMGNYMSANVANNLINKGEGWKGVWHGIKQGASAGNPFGDGDEKNEMSYSKVLGESGWKPKSTAGKVAKGVTGFALDVALDPTTYMTFGTGALIKGAGKSAVSASKLAQGAEKLGIADDAAKKLFKKGTMTSDVAKQIVSEQASRTGKVLDEATLKSESDKLVSHFHELVGTNRKNAGLGVGLKHSLANPLINLTLGRMDNAVGRTARKLANTHVELPGTAKALEAVSKVTGLDRGYAQLRKTVYGSKLGKALSSKHGLLKLANEDPARVYDVMDFVAKTRGFHADKVKEEQLIRDYVKQNLSNLTPAEQTKLMEALQDKTIWTQVKRTTGLNQMLEGRALKKQLEGERQQAQQKLDFISNQRTRIEQLRDASKMDMDGAKEALEQAEAEYYQNVQSLDLKRVTDKQLYENLMKEKQRVADELDAQFTGVSSPIKPKPLEVGMEEPVKPKRPYSREKAEEPVFDGIPAKPEYPAQPKMGDFVDESLTETQYNASGLLDEWNNLVANAEKGWKVSKNTFVNQRDVTRMADKFSQFIFGESGHISPAVYSTQLSQLAEMIDEGADIATLRDYINLNPHIFDGRMNDINSFVASHFGYKNWDDFYTKPIEEMNTKAMKEGRNLNASERARIKKLEDIRLERALMRTSLMKLDKRELKKFMTAHAQEKMFDDARNAVNREFKGRGFKEVDEARRGKFTDEDRALVDEANNKDLRTHEFDDKEGYDSLRLSSEQEDEVYSILMEKVFQKSWDNAQGIGQISDGQWKFMKAVSQQVEPLLKQFFNKSFDKLSPAQREFLVSMAQQHALVDVRGGTKTVDNVVKNAIKKRSELMEEYQHSEAVRQSARLGSTVTFKKGEKTSAGKITEIHINEEGLPEYTVTTIDGEKRMSPRDITRVKGAKPVDIVLENSIEREFSEATSKWEKEKARIDAEYEQAVENVKKGNVEKQAQYEAEVKRIKEEKKARSEEYKQAKEKYEADKASYDTLKRETEFWNNMNKADWEEAIRQSSDIADDYFKQYDDLMEEIKNLRSNNHQPFVFSRQAELDDVELRLSQTPKTVEKEVEVPSANQNTVSSPSPKSAEGKQIQSVFNAMGAGGRENGYLRTLELAKNNGFVEYRNPAAADMMRTNPEYTGWREEMQPGGIARFYPPADLDYSMDLNARIAHVTGNQPPVSNVANTTKKIIKEPNPEYDTLKQERDALVQARDAEKASHQPIINDDYEAMFKSVEDDFVKFHDDKVAHIADLEKEYTKWEDELNNLDSSTFSGKSENEWQSRFDELNDALKSDEAFESYVELKFAGDVADWDKKYGNVNVGKIILDSKSDYSDTVKRLAQELRDRFKLIGADEVDAKLMSEEQFAKWVDDYLPHLVTPHGKKFFEKYTLREVDGVLQPVSRGEREGVPSITQDLGYGEMWSPFNKSRSFKIKNPDGTWNVRPTIEQINEVMKPFLNNHNAFSDAISDIYVARAMKHTEMMYDEKYMNEMLTTFGEDLPADFIPKKGFKSVMNFGLFKRNINEMANLEVSLKISSDVSEFVKSLPRDLPNDEVERLVGQFVEQNFTDDVVEGIKNGFLDSGYGMLGLNRETFRETATPMLEMNPEQLMKMKASYDDVVARFQDNITKRKDNASFYGASQSQLDRIAKAEERLNKLSPLEMKQVHETIVQKANQSREIQIAKDRSKLVKLYDKFTHFMKLNQTTVMPSFHARNAMSNLFQVWLAVGNDIFDFTTHKMALKTNWANGSHDALKNLPRLDVKDKTGAIVHSYEWDEVYNLAQTHDVINEGFFAKDLGANDASNGLIKPLQNIKGKSFDPTDTKNNFFYNTGSNVGNFVENQARLFQFASMLKQGMSPEQAKAMVDKYLFDYSDLTAFEMNVMKRVFPYYTWLRKNARLQVSQVLEQPGKYRDVAKFMNGVEGGVPEEDKVQEQYLSDFAKNWKQTPFNYVTKDEDGNEVVEPILWNPNLPFMDLTRLPSANPADTIRTMLPQMNPLIKGVAELGTNKNFFFDDKIVEDKYYNPDSGEMEEPTLGQRLGKYGEYAMGQIAPLQAGVDMFKKQGIDKGLHMLNTGLGQKFLSYDYETSKDRIIKDYLGTGRKEEELWVDKQLKKLDNLPRNAQGKATKKLVDYVNSTPSSWVAKTVDGTSLEKYLLGNDIATAKVTGVRDGDTIDVKINGKHEAVRFSLIDTPEISHYQGEEAMPFSNEAKALTESLANGKDVRLVISKEKDMHGRLMAYVYVDGQDLNKKLLEDGLASMRYVNLSAQPYNEEEYRQVQNDAYQSGKGLWQLDGYADPEKEGYNKRGAMKRYLELIGGQ